VGGFPLGRAQVRQLTVQAAGVVPALYVVEDGSAELGDAAPGPGGDELSFDGGEEGLRPRRYANPASYLIAPEAWPAQRPDVLELTGMPATFAERLAAIEEETSRYLDDLETRLADPNGPVRLDQAGQLHLSTLSAEVVDPSVLVERDAVVARLPIVPLSELLIEIDRETGFSAHLSHAGGSSPRRPEVEHRRNLYAAILSPRQPGEGRF